MKSIVIEKAHITEKSMKLSKNGEYVFIVGKNSTKIEIAKAVAEKFDVKVMGVKTINVRSQSKPQRRGKGTYQTASFKKAIVKLAKGQRIGIFEPEAKQEVVVTSPEMEPIKEKKSLLRGTKVKVERVDVSPQSTQRKVITGK